MPYLQPVKKPHAFEGVGWSATAAEYEGVFPGGTEPRHYWLLCWRTDAMVISLSLTADKAVFDENRAFYRWLVNARRRLSNADMNGLQHRGGRPSHLFCRGAWRMGTQPKLR